MTRGLVRGFVAIVDMATRANPPCAVDVRICRQEAVLRAPGLRGYAATNAREAPDLHVEGDRLCLFHGWLAEPEAQAKRLGQEIPAAGAYARFVLAAYRQGGETELSRLRGEFSAVIIDRPLGSMLAIRDPLGLKPLYIHDDAGRVIVASSLDLLLPLLASPQLDPRAIADSILTNFFPRTPARTLYRGVSQVHPGHIWRRCVGKPAEERRYWRPAQGAELHYRSPHEYHEHFREHLFAAVAASIAGEHSVSCELSGGLDSSTVAAVAARLLTPGGGSVTALSYIRPADGLDERAYQEAVQAQSRLQRIVIELPNQCTQESLVGRTGVGMFLVQSLGPEGERIVDSLGTRVCLTGQGGDGVLANIDDTSFLADLRGPRQLASLCRSMLAFREVSSLRTMLRDVLASGPEPPRRAPGWLTHLPLPEAPVWRFSEAPARQRLFTTLTQLSAHYPEDPRRRTEYRHPLMNTSLMMFMLRVPWDQLVGPGESRMLQRHALADLLPDKVRLRADKTDFTRSVTQWFRLLARACPDIEHTPRLRALGVIHGDGYSRALGRALHGVVDEHRQPTFASALFEAWLTANDGDVCASLPSPSAAYTEAFGEPRAAEPRL